LPWKELAEKGGNSMSKFHREWVWQSEQATPEIPPEKSDPWQAVQPIAPSLAILAP